MKGLLEIIAACAHLQQPAALATLVRVKGSSYRQPGARMLFRPGGAQTGLISAGCLETDVKERIAGVLASGQAQLATYDLGSELDLVWGTGMGCQGRAEVLLENQSPGPVPAWMQACARMLEARRSGALATVFARHGEAEFQVGERFLVEDGGPGILPAPGPWRDQLLAAITPVRAAGSAKAVILPSGSGQLEILIEPILPAFALWIFGAGEHARPLERLAHELGWWIGLVDHRPALATRERFARADRIVLGHPAETLPGLPLDERSAALVVSHVYDIDRQLVAGLLPAPLGYLGLQGNRARSARILREVTGGQPLPPEQARRLHWPAGLDLGAESPEAIALSMLAEVQATLSGHPGGALGQRPGSIH